MALNTFLRRLILVGLFAVPFIPLIVPSSMFFPFITGKNFTFRVITEIIFSAWVILALRDPSARPKKSWIFYAYAVFIGVIAIADIFGENPYRSFWSNYERMEGLIAHLHLFAYFIVATAVLCTEKLWEKFFLTSFGANVAIIGHGIFQLSGVLPINQGGVRVDATFGNTTYLSVYLLFQIFLAAFFISRGGIQSGDRMKFPILGALLGSFVIIFVDMWGQIASTSQWFVIVFGVIFSALVLFFLTYFSNGKIFLWALALADLYLLYRTETRGAILGLICGLFITAVLLAFYNRDNKKVRNVSIGALVGLIALIGVFIAVKNTSFVKNNSTLSRFASISLNDGTTKSRFTIWNMSFEGFKQNPVLGWGQDNFIVVFGKYYKPSMWSQEPWFDRSHNVFFDWLIAGGALGLLAYLSLFGAGIWALWRGSFGSFEKSILAGLLGAYFAQNLFVFDNLTSYIQFFSVLGFISVAGAMSPPKGAVKQYPTDNKGAVYSGGFSPDTVAYASLPFILAAVVFVMYYANYKPIVANRTLIKAISPQKQLSDNIGYFKKVFALDTFGSGEAREQLIQVAARVRSSGASDADKQELFVLAAGEMKKQIESAPTDVRYELYLGSLLSSFGAYDEALKHLLRALELSPQKQPVLFEIATAYINKGEPASALPYLKQAYEEAPAYDEAAMIYAAGFLYARRVSEAERLLVDRFGTILIPDNRILSAYDYNGFYDRIIAIRKNQLEGSPKDQQLLLSLAAAYLKKGDRNNAVLVLQKMIDLDPAFKEQGTYYINEIRAGRNP